MEHRLHHWEDDVMSSLQCWHGRGNARHDHRVKVGSRIHMGMWGTKSIEIGRTVARTNRNTLQRHRGIGEQEFERLRRW